MFLFVEAGDDWVTGIWFFWVWVGGLLDGTVFLFLIKRAGEISERLFLSSWFIVF